MRFWTRLAKEKENEIMLRIGAAAVVVLAATTAFAQTPTPVIVPGGGPITTQGQMLPGRKGMSSLPRKPAGAAQAPSSLPKRIEDMQGTLTQMHAVLKRMHANSAKSQTKDALTKANLDMWELLVGHLDKQLQELRLAQAAREDMEARRAALYKQADAKANAEARAAIAARGFGGAQASTPSPTTQGAAPAVGQSTAGQAPASQTPPRAPALSSSSPN
jgi:hypothetical protein